MYLIRKSRGKKKKTGENAFGSYIQSQCPGTELIFFILLRILVQERIIIQIFSKHESSYRLKLGNRGRRGETETEEGISNMTHCPCNA